MNEKIEKFEKILDFLLREQGAVYCEICERVFEDLQHRAIHFAIEN